ncbi:MAG: ACT domain-containing protein [Desulfovibrio sp.]
MASSTPIELLLTAKEQLKARVRSGEVLPQKSLTALSAAMDKYFQDTVSDSLDEDCVVLAVGGYGGGELCFGSDVDVLILYADEVPERAKELSAKMFYPLWDNGFKVGHGVRDLAQCLDLALADVQVLTSLLECRALCGCRKLLTALQRGVNALMEDYAEQMIEGLVPDPKESAHSPRDILEEKLELYNPVRHSSTMLEPDLKNGVGGLRDGQLVFWVLAIVRTQRAQEAILPFSEDELHLLRKEMTFINGVRTLLHTFTKRPTDKLFFDLQPIVATSAGYAEKGDGTGVEDFLSRLHRSTALISSFRKAAVASLHRVPEKYQRFRLNKIYAAATGLDFSYGMADSASIEDMCKAVALTGLPMTWSAWQRLQEALTRNGQGPVFDNLHFIIDILRLPYCAEALRMMQESGILGYVLPAFARVEHMIQFDDYHVHPVGRHTVEMLAVLASFIQPGKCILRAEEYARRLADPAPLLYAALFHDLGKYTQPHSPKGAEILRETLALYDVSQETIEDAAFLVENHLLLPRVATRQDINDTDVLGTTAAQVESVRRLDMLYILSVADSIATGPRAWNSWSESLFNGLHTGVRRLLLMRSGVQIPKQDTDIIEAASKVLPYEFIWDCLHIMPERMRFNSRTEAVVSHLQIAHELMEGYTLEKGTVRVRPSEIPNCFYVTCAAYDRPALFALFTGIFFLHGLDILEAEISSWKNRIVIDDFLVCRESPVLDTENLEKKLGAMLNAALAGDFPLEKKIAARISSPLLKTQSGPALSPVVEVESISSKRPAIIEIAAPDRPGLLYELAHAISVHELNIILAKVTTTDGMVADVFHVLGVDGRAPDDEAIQRIKKNLLQTAMYRFEL